MVETPTRVYRILRVAHYYDDICEPWVGVKIAVKAPHLLSRHALIQVYDIT